MTVSPHARLRCPQCYNTRRHSAFIGAKGRVVRRCNTCRDRYKSWQTLSLEEKTKRRRPLIRKGLRANGTIRVHLIPESGNKKLGPIPASITSAETCPPSCSFYGSGCFAEFHHSRLFWSQVPERGVNWKEFCGRVAALPEGQLWRHNVSGDLPGTGERLNTKALLELVRANVGRCGFTFTHKNVLRSKVNAHVIDLANRMGFTVNLSADNLEHADRLAELDIGPVAVVLPADAPDEGTRTPAGRRVVVCPAQTRGRTCADCWLCYRTDRAIVGFRAHGQMAKHVSGLVQLRKAADA